MTTIKMSSRKAKLLLNTEDCKLRLNICFGVHHSEAGIKHDRTTGNDDLVYDKTLGEHIHLKNIEAIEFTDRFGNTSFMEVDWNE